MLWRKSPQSTLMRGVKVESQILKKEFPLLSMQRREEQWGKTKGEKATDMLGGPTWPGVG